MPFGIVFEPTIAGLSCAAVSVVAGAPLFSDGLRALRLARGFHGLEPRTIGEAAPGIAHVRGVVGLESPLFSPLSGTPCAGFRLEVLGPGGLVAPPVEQLRPFLIFDGEHVARVVPGGARLDLAERARRELKPGDALSENLRSLLQGSSEVRWLRNIGTSLIVTERVLAAGAIAHVVGTLRHSDAPERFVEETLERTGTDDLAVTNAVADSAGAPDGWIHAGEHLDFLLISDAEPRPEHFRVSRLRIAGAFVGPVLSLGGLLLLADAADRLRLLGG